MFFSVENLHINLGDFYLEDVSLGIEKGDYLSIIGPTGAGKSIFLESISSYPVSIMLDNLYAKSY